MWLYLYVSVFLQETICFLAHLHTVHAFFILFHAFFSRRDEFIIMSWCRRGLIWQFFCKLSSRSGSTSASLLILIYYFSLSLNLKYMVINWGHYCFILSIILVQCASLHEAPCFSRFQTKMEGSKPRALAEKNENEIKSETLFLSIILPCHALASSFPCHAWLNRAKMNEWISRCYAAKLKNMSRDEVELCKKYGLGKKIKFISWTFCDMLRSFSSDLGLTTYLAFLSILLARWKIESVKMRNESLM